jgi:trk system potassium uptake protein TrkA
MVINDDATIKETLENAGAERADALISTTDRDAVNAMVCLLAQELDVPAVVSVVQDPEHMSLFERIGVNTMENPSRLIAEYLYRAVERPSVVDYMRVGETAEVFEIEITPEAPVAGETLAEADAAGHFPGDLLVVAIERGPDGEILTPRGETVLEAGDVVTVFSAKGATPDVTDVFGYYENH